MSTHVGLIHERKNGSLDEIENSIKKRDLIDSTRKVAPLKIPKKAIVIDTENKNIDAVCQEIIEMVK